MKYHKIIQLKDGRSCLLRHAEEKDVQAVLDNFILTHEQTDYLLSYPDESSVSLDEEANYLKMKTESINNIELLAELDGKVVGLAGIDAIGGREKIKHRVELGISIDQAYWYLGIGTALLNACIECAKNAGYEQLELNVVGENDNAIRMYKKAGFKEFGRNPKGFKSRYSGYQELVYMYLDLTK